MWTPGPGFPLLFALCGCHFDMDLIFPIVERSTSKGSTKKACSSWQSVTPGGHGPKRPRGAKLNFGV
jgi:hypothetical protein